jgi:hypothetical protein
MVCVCWSVYFSRTFQKDTLILIPFPFPFPFTGSKTKAYCEKLAAKLGGKTADLPKYCLPYTQVKKIDAFAGMDPAAAIQARQTRQQGRESHAQIQRRLTSGATLGARRFSKLEK